jgi:hypothetical protein
MYNLFPDTLNQPFLFTCTNICFLSFSFPLPSKLQRSQKSFLFLDCCLPKRFKGFLVRFLQWDFLWFFSTFFCLNSFEQISHLKSLLWLWVPRCCRRVVFVLNDFSHFEHLKFFIWLWVIECLFRSRLILNAFPHSGHLMFLVASWWTAWWWFFKYFLVLKDLPQSLHSNSLLFSWQSKCRFKSVFLLKHLSQTVHLKSLRSLWTTEWSFKIFLFLNFFLQIEHSNDRFSFLLWNSRWFFRRKVDFRIFPQILHSHWCFIKCLKAWAFRVSLTLNNLPQ